MVSGILVVTHSPLLLDYGHTHSLTVVCLCVAEAALRNNGSFIKLRAVGSGHAKATATGTIITPHALIDPSFIHSFIHLVGWLC